jgi:AcrR family transcriptional regulator
MAPKRTQERGRNRRAALVEAARRLLRQREVDEISLTDIADEAGIPKSSAYHFFAHVLEVYEAAAGDMEAELIAFLEGTERSDCGDWRQVVTRYVWRGADYFNANRDATQLLIGPKTPASIKMKDRRNDLAIAALLREQIADRFDLPDLADTSEIFFHAIEVADLFFGLSVIRSGRIDDDLRDEAARATCAYLSLYLPPILTARGNPQ